MAFSLLFLSSTTIQGDPVNTLMTKTMPLMFAVSGDQAIPGLWGSLAIPRDAAGIVVITVRRLKRKEAMVVLGAHVMSPSHLPTSVLEERIAKVLRNAGVDVPLDQRVPATVPLPVGIAGNGVPIVALTLNVALGFERLGAVGGALRTLRDEGLILVGIAHDGLALSGKEEMGGAELAATVALLLRAASEEDRVAELGTRDGGLGFVLVPELHDALQDDGCCFWNAEAAGEMPQEVIEQLRPYLLLEEDGGEKSMKKKKQTSSIQITRFDKTRLMRLLRSLDAAQENRVEIEDLERELERGIEVDSTDVGSDVVTMNSTVRVTDLDANTTHLYTIVFPSDADFEKGRISILSPLGTALLGFRAGDVVTWEMPRGTRRLRIEELVYQPEAAGDFHL
jgi:regulator of nucleoside diphosphate kinase